MKRIINIAILLLGAALIAPSLSSGDSLDYFYDDNGRLVKAVNSLNNTRALYQYDEVGNLLGIYKETSASQALPPVLQGVDPDIFLIGNNYNIIITGQNLLTTSSVTSDDSNITLKFIAAIDTKIIAVLSIADTASSGQANITVTTSYGSASISMNLYAVSITPGEATLFPAGSADFTVDLTPSASEDVEVPIQNNNPVVINAPSLAIIPAGGSVDFTVDALQGGTGTLGIGNAEAVVYVLGGDDDSNVVLITSGPVCVSMSSIPSDAAISSMPVSVEFMALAGMTVFNSVSVEWLASQNTAASMPVSIDWTIFPNGVTMSLPVNVGICPALPVRVVGAATVYYNSLQSAYNAALDGDIIQAQAVDLEKDVDSNLLKSVTFDGGYNCDYSANAGETGLKGTLTISNGTVTINNFNLIK